jgi:hypothetical protein
MITFDSYAVPRFLSEAAKNLTFEVLGSRISEPDTTRGTSEIFEVKCRVAAGEYIDQIATIKFLKCPNRNEWHGFLKFFLSQFPVMCSEVHGIKVLKTPINEALIVGHRFVADSIIRPSTIHGVPIVTLSQFKEAPSDEKI